MGVLNLFIVLPQVIATCLSSAFQSQDWENWLFLPVAISFTLAAIAACFLQDKFVKETDVSFRRADSVASEDDGRIIL